MSPSRPRSAIVAATSSTPGRRVERAPPLRAEHRAAPRQRAAHRLHGERDRAPLAHAVPRVEEADQLVAVDALALADDGPDHRVQPWAVAATGEHADTHRRERTTRRRALLAIRGERANNRRRGMGRQPTGAVAPVDQGVADLRGDHDRRVRPAVPRRRLWPIIGGLLASGPLYLGLGYVLAKFGYQRKTLAELRTPAAPPPTVTATTSRDARPRPAPTRRTSTGPNRPAAKSRKR